MIVGMKTTKTRTAQPLYVAGTTEAIVYGMRKYSSDQMQL